MRPWERRGVGAEGGELGGREDTDTNTTTSSANESTSSSTAASGSSGARRNGAAAAAGEGWGRSPLSTATINLSQEYTLAIHTSSYHEIWAKIHVDGGDGQRADGVGGGGGGGGEEDEEDEDRCTLAGVLQPEDAVVERALGDAPDTELTRLAADYLSSTHHASLLCLSLRRALRRARALYGPITDLLALIPHAPPLSAPHRDCAFDAFLLFDQMPNPFPAPAAGFQGMHRSFVGLKNHLDLRLLRARRRRRLVRCATRGSGICLIACATGAAIAGLVLATHAITVLLAAAPACAASRGSCCPAAASMKRLQQHMDRLDAAARGAYVLNNDVDTIERLVGRLHATVESDKLLVRLGLERGRGEHHTIEEVVRQLRKNHPSLLRQLADLEEHICLYFAAVNRARLLLDQQFHGHCESAIIDNLLIAFAVDPTDYIQYDEADVASQEAVWALYERWRDFYGAERSHDEMLRRFGMFKDKARHVLKFNKSGASFTKALKEGADLTLEENAKRLGIRRRL
uniref:Cathepsin propeptide inhibitor domain-containing protein n=1 Tax=Oryza meridionalis TaxID=40149 RepID=A0A0E0DDN4_9ORYZ